MFLHILYSDILQFLNYLFFICRFNTSQDSSTFPFYVQAKYISFCLILLLLLLLLLLCFCCCCCCCCCLLSRPLPHYFSYGINGNPHRSGLKFQAAVLSVLCVMIQVQLSFVLNILNVLLHFFFVFWSCFALPFIGQTAVVSAFN